MTKKIAIFMFTLLISGCSTSMATLTSTLAFWQNDLPLQVVINITAANNINPNLDNLASPLEIRVYQLQDSEAFNQASFIDIYNDDQGVLKEGVLSKRNLASLLPNEKRQVKLPLITETKYIAIIAAFSNYREAKSKAIVQITPGLPAAIDVNFDGVNISITGQED
jgi:type VI secretion system protein VasD